MAAFNKKRFIIRVILILLLLALCCVLYYFGKEHSILLDNQTVEIDGKEYAAADYMQVIVNGDEENSIEFYADDRDEIKIKGPHCNIKVIIMDEDTEQVIKSVETVLNLGTEGNMMFSLPALAENAPNARLPMPVIEAEPEQDDQSQSEQSDETQSPDGNPTGPAENGAPGSDTQQ